MMSDLHGDTDNQGKTLLADRVYQSLRSRIISGEFPPGARLRERELAKEFVVSRIPLREAIPQLEAEGFVTSLPRRGAVVTQLTMRDVEELFEVRLGVEVFANQLAAQRIAAGASGEALETAMERCRAALRAGHPDQIAECNAEFHEGIVELADNSLLTSMLRTVAGRDRWIFRLTASRDPFLACQEHQSLCEAIIAGNAQLAGALAYAHIENGREPTFAGLREVLPQDPSESSLPRHSPA